MNTTQGNRPAMGAMYVGLALTVVAMIAPYLDRANGHSLAAHIRDGYPTYTPERIEAAVTTWLVILSVVGALGVASWVFTIWATATEKTWSRVVATIAFALGTGLALTAMLTTDTSGDPGLAPLLGWIGLLPCVPGMVAVAMLWRRS